MTTFEKPATISGPELHQLIAGIVDLPVSQIAGIAIAIALVNGNEILTGSSDDHTVNCAIMARLVSTHMTYLAIEKPK